MFESITSVMLLWEGANEWRTEAALLHPRSSDGPWGADGVQLGVAPMPYRLDYRIELDHRLITTRLEAWAAGTGWTRSIDLRHDGKGHWSCVALGDGAPELGELNTELEHIDGAIDCDLGFSPLTNAMPVQRQGLVNEPGEIELLVAWVSVPDLRIHASRQRYEHVAPGRVRYESDSAAGAELQFDNDGFVRDYPGLAHRRDA